MWLGYYKSSEVSGGCTPCSCDAAGTIPRTICDRVTGQCQCVQGGSGVGGPSCDSCLPRYKYNVTRYNATRYITVSAKYSLTHNKLLQKVFQLILLGFSVLFNILKVYQNRSPRKVFFSRWRPRWPPKLSNGHKSVTINSN